MLKMTNLYLELKNRCFKKSAIRFLLIPSIILFILFMASCSDNNSIDMEKVLDNVKKDEKRIKNADEARKSIFPNLKE